VPSEDPEERAERRALMSRTLRENCLICHSDEMIHSQRLTPKQWKAEVDKMVGWGAPVPPEHRQLLTDFLAEEYPADAAPAKLEQLPLRELASQSPSAAPADPLNIDPQPGALLYARDCANCHGVSGQGAELGPNLVEKPVLLSVPAFNQVVREGRGRMPGFATVLDEKGGQAILAWLRGRRYQPALPVAR
jgi:mono/diheme cytochrome c family protein